MISKVSHLKTIKLLKMSGRTVDDYGEKDLHTHIYDVPDTYVGSTNLEIKEEIIFDFETKKNEKS